MTNPQQQHHSHHQREGAVAAMLFAVLSSSMVAIRRRRDKSLCDTTTSKVTRTSSCDSSSSTCPSSHGSSNGSACSASTPDAPKPTQKASFRSDPSSATQRPFRAFRVELITSTVVFRVLVLGVLSVVAVMKHAWYGVAVLLLLTMLELAADYQITKYIIGKTAKTVSTSTDKQQESVHSVDPRFTGAWVKVPELSDSMLPSVAVLQLGGLAKQAVKLFKGVKIRVDRGSMEITAFTLIPFLQARAEKYQLSGAEGRYPRRDLRRGTHVGSAQVEPDGSVLLRCRWVPPFGGEATDEFLLKGPHELHVTTTLAVGKHSCKYTVVYHRSG